MAKPIAEQVVVIVGASSGIGLRTAQEAARRGAKVVLAARNVRDLEHAVDAIHREGGEAIAVPTDVVDHAQVERLAHRAVEAFGRIDTWVNNAAVSLYGTFDQVSLDDFRRIMEVNFLGQVHGAQAALPHLERTAGALVCVGSALSDRGVPLQGAYCASKHALKGWLDALRVELRQRDARIRVTLVKPSSIDTPLFNKARTLLGVMPRPIPPVYAPELAAAAILHAAEGDERDVYVGGAGKLLAIAERINPKLLDWQQLRHGFDGQRTAWPKLADAQHNLYGPVEHDGGVRGDFTRETTNHSMYQQLAAQPGARRWSAAVLGLGLLLVSRARRRAIPALVGAGMLALAASWRPRARAEAVRAPAVPVR